MWTSEVSPWFLRICAFAFGSVWGSFFNVAIYRWPREMSIISPPSQCFSCGKPIRWYHNVPLLGYLALGGKSACCGAKIPARYFMVEVIAAAMALAIMEKFAIARPEALLLNSLLEVGIYFVFAGGLIIATFVDLEWMLIPDEVSLVGAAFGLATATMRTSPGIDEIALGAGGAFLIVQLFFVWGYERALGRRGMGEGDSKLLMMIGAFLGWRGAVFSLIVGSLQGLAIAAVFLVLNKPLLPENVREAEEAERKAADPTDASDPDAPQVAASDSTAASTVDSENPESGHSPLRIPFGPFLALGALEFLLFGETLLEWYSSFFQE